MLGGIRGSPDHGVDEQQAPGTTGCPVGLNHGIRIIQFLLLLSS
jgi:hypothetical protein